MQGHQLEWLGTPHLSQHRVGDFLLVVVPRHGSRGRPTRGCALMDPVGPQEVHRPRLLSRCRGKDVMGKFGR
jgi:hypothetical protein